MKQDSGKKIFIKSFGCQMNEYDASRMVDLMREHDGMTQTDNMEEADVILLNTCSVREKAEEKPGESKSIYKNTLRITKIEFGKYVRNQKQPRLDELQRIAQWLGVSPKDLVNF